MSGRIGPRPYRKLEKVLRQHGFQAVRQKGSHDARLSSDDLE